MVGYGCLQAVICRCRFFPTDVYFLAVSDKSPFWKKAQKETNRTAESKKFHRFDKICDGMKDWTRKIIGLSLVALFAGYYGGTTLFYHAHEIDGVKIVHSHPYTGDAQHHAHSAASCRTIQLLSGLTFLTSALALLPRVFRQLSARRQEHLVAARQQWENHPFFLRGPPRPAFLS